MKPFLTLMLTASAPTVVQARGGCGAHENCALLCRVADRDDDGRVDRGEMHAFLTLFGAAAHAHGNGDDGGLRVVQQKRDKMVLGERSRSLPAAHLYRFG